MTATPAPTRRSRGSSSPRTAAAGWEPERETITYADDDPARRHGRRVAAPARRRRPRSTPAAPGSARCPAARSSLPASRWSRRTASGGSAGPAERADRARARWFEQRFQQVFALLLRPDRPDPGPRAGLRAARRPAPDRPGRRPAARAAGRGLGGVERTLRPARD